MKIGIIPSRIHATVDYSVALFLIWFSLRIPQGEAIARYTTLGIGLILGLVAVLEICNLSFARISPTRLSQSTGKVMGLSLLLFPLIVPVEKNYYWVYCVLGVLIGGLALLVKRSRKNSGMTV